LAVLPVPPDRLDHWSKTILLYPTIVDIPTDLPPSTKRWISEPTSTIIITDHIANIVSESQAWKIDCRHHQLTPSASEPSVRINSSSFCEPASRFSAERAGNWKKVREQVLEYGWMQLEETYKYV
jgi:hypothetical protein